MSNLQTLILLGLLAWVVLVWILARVISFGRQAEESQLDDMEQVAAVSRPAPLEPRPHVRAGGQQAQAPAPTSARVQRTPLKP